MCYSGICRFEDYYGECKFPLHITEIKKRFPTAICHTDDSYKTALEEFDNIMKRINRKNKLNAIRNS